VLLLSLVVLVMLGGIAYQGWRIVEAIVQAEHSAVVPWPTRVPAVAFVPAATSTPDAHAQVAPTATPSGRGTAPAGEPTPAVTVPATIEPSETAEPTPSPTATPPLDSGSGETSHFGVVKEIVGAGADDGDPGLSPIWGGRTSLNILIVGVDRRAEGGDQNADVLIIAHVDLIDKRVAAVSIPRDLLVDIPGIGPDKINGSYNYGVLADPDNSAAGVGMVRDTVESVFGVTLDGYVLVDFDGFEAVVDSVGGVEIDVPYEIVDESYPTEDYGTEVVTFEPGVQHMDGETALKYVRTRHGDDDDARRQRQYQVLLALFDTGQSLGSVTKSDEIIDALGDSVQTSFPFEQQLTLARLGAQMERDDIRLSSLAPPLLTAGYTDDGKWVYIGDVPTIVSFVQDALKTDPEYMTADNGLVQPEPGS
jgi:LCP family protein required for cell wall assembly